MRQITNKINCSHGSIYYHFKNKAELFYALVEDHFSILNKKMVEVLQEPKDNSEKLRNLLLGFIEFGLNYQSHYEIMFLIKYKEVLHFLNKRPIKTYEKLDHAVSKLSPNQSTLH